MNLHMFLLCFNRKLNLGIGKHKAVFGCLHTLMADLDKLQHILLKLSRPSFQPSI